MPEPDPIAELLAQVAGEHHFGNPQGGTAIGSTCECTCGEMNRSQGTRGMALNKAFAHLAEVQAAALRDAGHVTNHNHGQENP